MQCATSEVSIYSLCVQSIHTQGVALLKNCSSCQQSIMVFPFLDDQVQMHSKPRLRAFMVICDVMMFPVLHEFAHQLLT